MNPSIFRHFRLLLLLVFQAVPGIGHAAPAAPTNCVATGIGNTSGGASIILVWNDNSITEVQWVIEYTVGGGVPQYLPLVSKTGPGTGPTAISLNAEARTNYSFRIYADDGSEYSGSSNWSSVSTAIFALTASRVPGQISINLSWPNIQNESGYRIESREAGTNDYLLLGSVAADITGYQVSSPLIEVGKTYSFKVRPIAGGSVVGDSNVVIVRPPSDAPVIGMLIPGWTGVGGGSRITSLDGTFLDPEAESAVRVSTTVGDMDFILFDTATPATVANFMSYVNSGKYTDVAFHRSIAGFVIQGGGFKGAGTGSNFTSVVTLPPVVNEPGVANELGTVSMAKLGSNPDSATSQFFVSLGDNRANLDYQNGGFTVFGRVAGNGMSVAEAISLLPKGTYDLFLNGSATAAEFKDFPMNAPTLPSPMDQTKLVKINSVTPIPTLSYSITGNTDPAVASANIVNGQLHLVALKGGQTTLTVTATDLDNLTTSQSVAVNLTDTYATWKSRNSFPNAEDGPMGNPDGDAWNNLQEFAFLGEPALSSPTSEVVFSGISGVAPSSESLTVTFPVRKFAQGLVYAVESNNNLSGAWTEIWNSMDGFVHPQVIGALTQSDRTVVTIQDPVATGNQTKRFLRVKTVLE